MSDLSDFLLVTRREPVTLPGAPGPLYIRELLAEALLALTSGPDSTFAALAACLEDEAGQPVITAEQARRLPRGHYQALVAALNRVNGWDEEAVTAALGE